MRYLHKTIIINHREAALSEIVSGSAASFSEFEEETFSFIKNWLTNIQTFTLHTSGSTGTPKEIILTRSQLINSAKRTIDRLGLSKKNTALVCLDTRYIAGKMMLVRALEANMKIVAVEPSSNPLKNLTVQPDFGAFVPLQLAEIVKDRASVNTLNKFQSIIIGGAAVSTSLIKEIKTLSCDVYATYGMTETVSHIALQKLTGDDAQDYFETLPGISIHVDKRGCLVIDLPDFSKPIVTNDLVDLIDQTSFRIQGRYDTIINSGGIKLVPEIIEKKLSLILKQSFFVAGIPDERLGKRLVLVVEGKPDPELASSLRLALSMYEIPKEILFLDPFILTETQKINRAETIEKALKSRS